MPSRLPALAQHACHGLDVCELVVHLQAAPPRGGQRRDRQNSAWRTKCGARWDQALRKCAGAALIDSALWRRVLWDG